MMKKLFSGIALAAILVSGVFFAVNAEPEDLTWGERHPPILLQSGIDFDSAF